MQSQRSQTPEAHLPEGATLSVRWRPWREELCRTCFHVLWGSSCRIESKERKNSGKKAMSKGAPVLVTEEVYMPQFRQIFSAHWNFLGWHFHGVFCFMHVPVPSVLGRAAESGAAWISHPAIVLVPRPRRATTPDTSLGRDADKAPLLRWDTKWRQRKWLVLLVFAQLKLNYPGDGQHDRRQNCPQFVRHLEGPFSCRKQFGW